MLIIGQGLIAGALRSIAETHADTVAFATGVSDSSCTNRDEYDREVALLSRTIASARSSGDRLMYFSSGGAVYGRWSGAANEDTVLNPQTDYGRHKVRCEELIRGSGVRHLIVRLPNVVGDTGNARQLVPGLVAQVLAGHVRVFSKAERDLVDSTDLAPTVDELLTALSDPSTINVATGRSVTAATIVGEICRILGAMPVIDEYEAGDVQVFDVHRMRRVIGRDPFPRDGYISGVLDRHVPLLAARVRHDAG